MAEREPERIFSGIDIPKALAGALAAVCAAVVGSYLGVGGTLIGAAVASVVGTIGTEVYHRSFQRGQAKLHTIAPAFVKVPAAIGTPPVAAATDDDAPAHTVAAGAGPPAPPQARQLRWGRIGLLAAAVFVLAMGALTTVELITGRSVASTVGNGTGAKTTFGGLLHPGHGTATPAPTPSLSPTVPATVAPSTASASTAPTTEPSAPQSVAPSEPPPSAPDPTVGATATGAPATGAPAGP